MKAEQYRGPSLLALVGDMTGPTIWRALFPITALEKTGYACGWDRVQNDAIGSIAPHFDGYMISRVSWPDSARRQAEAWFTSVRRAGKFVVYDTDDDVFGQAETHRRVELNWQEGKTFEQLEEERRSRIWTVQQCDGVTVTTQRLATIVRQYTDKPVIVVPNSTDLPWFRSVLAKTERTVPGLTVGWAGGRRHDRDVEPMAEAWGRIARRYPDVTFVVQGWQPPVIAEHVPADRLVQLPWMRPESYPAGLKQMDIGCAPLADTPFNRAKSPIKVMEYAAAGAAVVASPLLYSTLVEDGRSGHIATTADEWEWALSGLIQSPALRSMMARRLLRAVEKQHALSVNLWRWPAAWAEIQQAARASRFLFGIPGVRPQLTGIMRG